eukprot:553449-Pelagomonas_calceolata.AAC.5
MHTSGGLDELSSICGSAACIAACTTPELWRWPQVPQKRSAPAMPSPSASWLPQTQHLLASGTFSATVWD